MRPNMLCEIFQCPPKNTYYAKLTLDGVPVPEVVEARDYHALQKEILNRTGIRIPQRSQLKFYRHKRTLYAFLNNYIEGPCSGMMKEPNVQDGPCTAVCANGKKFDAVCNKGQIYYTIPDSPGYEVIGFLQDRTLGADRFLRINGHDFSFQEVAKALGVKGQVDPIQVSLCQRVPDGILVAKGAAFEKDDYPGIDVELELPKDHDSLPVMLTRTEQPRGQEEEAALRTFCFSRQDEYFMYFDADLRPDWEAEEQLIPPNVHVAGNPGFEINVEADNPYMKYLGYRAIPRSNSLNDQLRSAERRDSTASKKQGNLPHKDPERA